jgi:hypothetical protein
MMYIIDEFDNKYYLLKTKMVVSYNNNLFELITPGRILRQFDQRML